MLEAPRNMLGLLVQLEDKARENPDDIQLMLRLARLYLKNGAGDDSVRIYQQILKTEPENASALVELANCHIRQRQFEEASFLLERAQEIKPGLYSIFLTFAKLHEAQGNVENQVSFMMRAANAAPEKTEIRLALAEMLKRYGDFSGATGQYRILLEQKPDLEAALFALGTMMMKRNELNEAMKCFRKILDKNPGAFDAHFNLANCLFRQRKFKMAINHFRIAGRKQNLVERSLYLSAQSFFQLKDFDRAIVAMEKLVLLDENNISYQKSLAEIYFAAGELDLSRDVYRQLAKIAPERPEFQIKFAEMLVLLEDYSRAEKALDTLFRIHPGHLDGHRILGEIYQRKGLYKAAVEEFKRTLMLNENHTQAYLGMAKVYAETGELQKEHDCLQRAVELGVENPELLLKLGQIENRLKLPASLDRFRRVTELAPDSDCALEAEYYLKHQAA
ncbi:MAG: hypothetical protein PWR01_3940 [Clostridiales bacterium]|nr:hypothetical protein [Clostridiales bacterium]MDN5282867.1 hypothetical protein [Candidatus Ozemobacter sp.]